VSCGYPFGILGTVTLCQQIAIETSTIEFNGISLIETAILLAGEMNGHILTLAGHMQFSRVNIVDIKTSTF
jgi:hypothetical protein